MHDNISHLPTRMVERALLALPSQHPRCRHIDPESRESDRVHEQGQGVVALYVGLDENGEHECQVCRLYGQSASAGTLCHRPVLEKAPAQARAGPGRKVYRTGRSYARSDIPSDHTVHVLSHRTELEEAAG